MRQFLTVFKFEFLGFLKEKVYIFSTLFLCLVMGIAFFFPRFMSTQEGVEDIPAVSESDHSYALYDPMNVLTKEAFLQVFPNSTLIKVDSLEQLKQHVAKLEVDAGYYLKNDLQYEYYVYNSSITDENQKYFENLMITQYRNKELAFLGTDVEKIKQILSTTPSGSMIPLGKDGFSGYSITYAMIIFIYVLILLYGSLISTKVASEKSNRTIEILVTSTSSNALIFGKVLASALAGLLQMGIVAAVAYVCYRINIVYWSMLGSVFAYVSLPIVLTCVLFGLFGYLLYSFMFGALGALVDKIEDVNASVTPIMLLFVISFIITISNLLNIDGMIIKVASFVPFSSCLEMPARMVTGNVMLWEIMVSFIILVLSTGVIGYIGAKIYRRGTLMYGNKGKLWKVVKLKE